MTSMKNGDWGGGGGGGGGQIPPFLRDVIYGRAHCKSHTVHVTHLRIVDRLMALNFLRRRVTKIYGGVREQSCRSRGLNALGLGLGLTKRESVDCEAVGV